MAVLSRYFYAESGRIEIVQPSGEFFQGNLFELCVVLANRACVVRCMSVTYIVVIDVS